MEENKKVTIGGKTYRLVEDYIGGGDECSRCALQEYCDEQGGRFCLDEFGDDDAKDHRFELCAEPLTEQQAYDAYQERSETSGSRADALAWAMLILLAAQIIGGSKYQESYVMAASAVAYMLLSVLQAVWQSVAIWLVKQRIAKTDDRLTDYPEWVGGGAWLLYGLKMTALTAGAVYCIVQFLRIL